jgi:hypothetical protein
MKNITIAIVLMAIGVFVFLKKVKERKVTPKVAIQKTVPAATTTVADEKEYEEEEVKVAVIPQKVKRKPIIHEVTEELETIKTAKVSAEKGLYCADEHAAKDGQGLIGIYFDGKSRYYFWENLMNNMHFLHWKMKNSKGLTSTQGKSAKDFVGGRYTFSGKELKFDLNAPSGDNESVTLKILNSNENEIIDFVRSNGEGNFSKTVCSNFGVIQ